MDRPGISAEDLYSHHANFIVRFFPGQAVDLFQDFGHQDKIAACVRKRCRELGRTYEEIMDLAHNRQWDEIQRIKSASDPSSSQLLQSRDNSLPSTPLRPTIPFPSPGYTNQNHPPSPAPTASTSRSHMLPPLECITVLCQPPVPLTMLPTLDGWNHIRADVAERLGGVRLESPEAGTSATFPGNRHISPPYCCSVQLSFVRQNSHKSHRQRFFLNDALEKADVLVNYEPFQDRPKFLPDYASGGPPITQSQDFSQMPRTAEYDAFRTSNDGYPPGHSNHASSATTRSPVHSSRYDLSMHHMRNMPPPAPTPPAAVGRDSPIQRPQSTVIYEPQPSRMNSTSNISQQPDPAGTSYNKVTGIYSWSGSQSKLKRTFDLCPTGESFISTSKKVCRLLKIKFDRTVLCVDFVCMANKSSHLVSLDGDTFQDDWPMALEFLESNRSEAKPEPDFEMRIESLDDDG